MSLVELQTTHHRATASILTLRRNHLKRVDKVSGKFLLLIMMLPAARQQGGALPLPASYVFTSSSPHSDKPNYISPGPACQIDELLSCLWTLRGHLGSLWWFHLISSNKHTGNKGQRDGKRGWVSPKSRVGCGNPPENGVEEAGRCPVCSSGLHLTRKQSQNSRCSVCL